MATDRLKLIEAIYKCLPEDYREISEVHSSDNWDEILSKLGLEREEGQEIFLRVYDPTNIVIYEDRLNDNEIDRAVRKGTASLGYRIKFVLKETARTRYLLEEKRDLLLSIRSRLLNVFSKRT